MMVSKAIGLYGSIAISFPSGAGITASWEEHSSGDEATASPVLAVRGPVSPPPSHQLGCVDPCLVSI